MRSSIALPGLGLAVLGVLAFSFTFPATVMALDGFGPYLIGVGRAVIAAVPAGLGLLAVRARLPTRDRLPGLLGVAAGVVFGFPILSTLALDLGASSSHSAVVIGLLPIATAVFAALRAGERPSAPFWVASTGGALVITVFALSRGSGHLTPPDLLLFAALLAGGMGYAEGGRLARSMPAWRVISWALVLATPVTVPVTVVLWARTPVPPTGPAVLGLAYLGLVSMFLGFLAWYAGLARAGVARAGQVQLGQPILTLVWSWLLLDERLGTAIVLTAGGVLCSVVITQRARVRAPSDITLDGSERRKLSQDGSDDQGRAPDTGAQNGSDGWRITS